MQIIKRRILYIFTCAMLAGSAFAAGEGVPLADVVNTFVYGGGILTKLMWAVCIVVGIALIAAAFTQFQIHRRNPKLVPLATPTLYLILGICAITIPFMGQIKGFLSPGNPGVKGAPVAPRPQNKNQNINDIDAPLY